MTAEVGVSWGRGVVTSGTQWCYHEAQRCNDAWRVGGGAATAAVLTTDVTQLLAHCASLAKQGSADLLCRRVLLLLLALNPRMTGAQRELLQAMVRTSLEQALYEHSVEAPVLRSIVVLACPSQHAAAKLMRAIDLVLSYLVAGDAAAGQRDGHARAGEPLAAALAAHHTPSISGAASPEAAALTATIHPVVWQAPGRRRAAGLVRGRGGAEVSTRRHRPLPPAVGLYSHAHAMLLARYRAHPNALDALSPAVASAVLRALEADGGSDGGMSQPALPLLGAGVQVPEEEARMDASPLVCGITLEPVLDARGHLVPGTVALVQATSQGVLHAHLYRGPALATWLAGSGGRGHTHPATRAPVDAERHVHPLC